mmetsp:Transcript_25431/g.82254  ORF Transcript_25431/g.82254 Transcript_25431/m.82254 type:complete len:382 (+) Transcript_25431:810-1955(+)
MTGGRPARSLARSEFCCHLCRSSFVPEFFSFSKKSRRGDIVSRLDRFRYDGSEEKTSNLTLAPCEDLWRYYDGNPRLGDLIDLLTWHCEDPVSPEERKRNDDVCVYWQGNRNPFVDSPELVFQYYGDPGVAFDRCRSCVDNGTTNLTCEWSSPLDCATISDVATVYDAAVPSEPAPVEGTVTEEDEAATATTTAEEGNPVVDASTMAVFINEFHYDNVGQDANEAVEIAAPAGTDLSLWSLVLYNGADGKPYKTIAAIIDLDEQSVPDDDGDGVGFVAVTIAGIQNGPDGIALVDEEDACRQFLSYEGTFTATTGPCAGFASTPIAVSELGGDDTDSLQLTGAAGARYGDFAWSGPAPSSFGSVNDGQSFRIEGESGSDEL